MKRNPEWFSELGSLAKKFPYSLTVVDAHTAGSIARLLVRGFPPVQGANISDRLEYFQHNLDYIRVALMQEPRGHESCCGAILLPPSTPEEDLSCLFVTNSGYTSVCGHVSLAIGNFLKQVSSDDEPISTVSIGTPSGIIQLNCSGFQKYSNIISLKNVPSFLYCETEIEIPNIGTIPVAVSFGGNFYVLVDARNIPNDYKRISVSEMTILGEKIRNVVNSKIEIHHPIQKHLNSASLVMFYGLPECECGDTKTLTTWGENQFDRSPCVTGTSALLGYLYWQDKIGVDEEYKVESIIGTTFIAKIKKEVAVDRYVGVITEVAGHSYITGFNQIVVDPQDPIGAGFKTPGNLTVIG